MQKRPNIIIMVEFELSDGPDYLTSTSHGLELSWPQVAAIFYNLHVTRITTKCDNKTPRGDVVCINKIYTTS